MPATKNLLAYDISLQAFSAVNKALEQIAYASAQEASSQLTQLLLLGLVIDAECRGRS